MFTIPHCHTLIFYSWNQFLYCQFLVSLQAILVQTRTHLWSSLLDQKRSFSLVSRRSASNNNNRARHHPAPVPCPLSVSSREQYWGWGRCPAGQPRETPDWSGCRMLNVWLAIKFIQIPRTCIPCYQPHITMHATPTTIKSPLPTRELSRVEMTRCGKMVEKKFFYRYFG